jgi:phage-related protein
MGVESNRRSPSCTFEVFKKLTYTDDILEIRIKVGSDIFRLLGFFDGANLVVLDYAFQKKTQKTPRQAIKVAEGRKHDYFDRRKE